MSGRLFLAALLALSNACSGCGGGGSDAGSDAGPPSLAVQPAGASANAGGAGILFRALALNATGTVNWSLSPAVGSLSTTSGQSTLYLPPASVPATTQLTLTATDAADALTATATIAVSPGGTLVLKVSAPPLLSPSIAISGPNGFARTVSSSLTLGGVAPGPYTVTAPSERIPGPIVDVLYDGAVTGSPAIVADGQSATVSVSYAQRGGTGALWVTSGDAGAVEGLALSQLVADAGTPVTLGALGSPRAGAVDATGALWIADSAAGAVFQFTATQLAAGGAPSGRLGGDAGTLATPVALTFDPSGNLWIALAGDQIQAFSAASLLLPGATPFATVADTAGGPNGPVDLAFDSRGDLWVVHATSGTVVGYSGASQWMGAVSPAPSWVIGPLGAPRGLAFDALGNLWVSASGAGTVVEFPALGGGQPGVATDAGVVLLGTFPDGGVAFAAPAGIAFDATGDLWLTTDLGAVSEFSQLSGLSGRSAVLPVALLQLPPGRAGKPAFDPPPADLPLRQ